MPYSGTMTFSKLLLDRGRMICPRLLLELKSIGGSMPYSGTITLSKLLLEDCSESSFTLELEDLAFWELDDFSSLELEDFACLELLDSAESSSLTLEELLASAFLLELDDFFCLELDDFSSLELEESAFFELLETAFAEELVSMTVSSFSLSLLAAMVESPSQLAQNAAVTERTIFFQCLFKKMLICLPFGEKYTKIRR